MLESRAAANGTLSGSYSFLGDDDDLTTYNLDEENPVEFKVNTSVNVKENLPNATVKVTWQVGEKIFELKLERTIFVANQ